MSEDIRSLVEELEGIGDDLAPDFMELVGQALDVELARWRANAPKASGDLARSIEKRMIDSYTWGIYFNDYGYYQNFGVVGTENKTNQVSVANFVPSEYRPSAGDKYGFKSRMIGGDLPFGVRVAIARDGLNAKKWFPVTDEQLDQILQRVADRAIQSIEI